MTGSRPSASSCASRFPSTRHRPAAAGALLAFAMTCTQALAQAPALPISTFTGLCDASAAVALDDDRFVVADDEHNVLQVFRQRAPGAPVASVDLAPLLERAYPREIDIEAAARIGDRIYWIGSHGRSAKGARRDERRTLFATTIARDAAGEWRFTRAGTPYHGLVDAMATAPALAAFALGAAARKAAEAPGGLDIEGLAATPDGALLIGFRNPLPQQRALVVPLVNPAAVLDGAAPAFGPPVLLDLGGLGIRSLDRDPGTGDYLVVAGPAGDGGPFRLYRWRGDASAPNPLAAGAFGDLNPEALAVFGAPGFARWMVSDDGARRIRGNACKDLPAAERRFRAVRLHDELLR